jgi:hypothetical protein
MWRQLADARHGGGDQAAPPAETEAGEDDRQVMQMLEDIVPVELRDGREVMQDRDTQDGGHNQQDAETDLVFSAVEDP